jgi:uncharacterized membrane protein
MVVITIETHAHWEAMEDSDVKKQRFGLAWERCLKLPWETILFWMLFCVLSAFVARLIGTPRWLPFLDFGSHVQMFDIVQRIESPETVYRDVYDVLLLPAPNVLTLWVAKVVAPIMDARVYTKGIFLIGLIGLPASLAWLARETDRSPLLGLVGFALCLNQQLVDGYVNWMIGLPMMFSCFALLARYERRQRTSDGMILSACVLLLFFVHGLAWLFTITVVSFWLLIRSRSWRDIRATFFIPLPAALVALPSVFSEKAPASGSFEGRSFSERVNHLGQSSIDIFHDSSSQWLFYLVIALAIFLLTHSFFGHQRRSRVKLPLFVLFATAIVYFSAPVYAAQFYGLSISDRFAVPMLAALVLFAGDSSVREELPIAKSAMVVGSIVIGVYFVHATSVIHENYQRHTAPKEHLVEQVPDGAWLGTYVDTWSDTMRIRQQHETVGMHAVMNGGPHADGFQRAKTSVVRFQTNRMPPWSNLTPISRIEADSLDYMIIESRREPGLTGLPSVEVVDRIDNYWLLKNTGRGGCLYDTCAGGVGGTARTAVCREGARVEALQVATRQKKAASLALQCEAQEKVVEWQEQKHQHTDTAECRKEDHMVGVWGYLSGSGEVIHGLGAVCKEASSETSYRTPPIGSYDVGTFEITCDDGRPLIGVNGRSGAFIDRVEIVCGHGGD